MHLLSLSQLDYNQAPTFGTPLTLDMMTLE
jgi:hypothetical protein